MRVYWISTYTANASVRNVAATDYAAISNAKEISSFVTHFARRSAKSAGQPNQAEVWLKNKGYVSENFHFSMKWDVTLFSRWTINIHFHHWLYCAIMIFVVNFLETRTNIGSDISEDIGDFVMGWLYGMGTGGVSQGLSYSDWTHCVWLTPAPPGLRRRISSLESIISVRSDPNFSLTSETTMTTDDARPLRKMTRELKQERPIVLRRETLRWTVALISLGNMAVGLPVFLGVISPRHFLPALAALCESDIVERIFAVGLGLAAIQLGLLRWLMVRNFGKSRGLRWLAAGSFLLEVLRDGMLAKEGVIEPESGWKIGVPSGILAVSLFLIQPESDKLKTI